MKHSRLLFIVIIAFSLGFALHFLITNLQTKPEVSLLLQQRVAGEQTTADNFITYIDYDGNDFEPSSVIVTKGNYIAITNKSKEKLMWLVSDDKDLNTARGYGEGERLQLVLLKGGQFKVANKLNPKAWFSVTVQE